MHISLQAEKIFEIAGWPVNNSLLAGVLASVMIIVIFWIAARSLKNKPNSRFGQAVEALIEGILGAIEDVTHDRSKAVRFFPLLMTLFIFILLSNWMGLLPGFGSITITTHEGAVPLLRGANADLNTTLALAVISVVMTQVYAIRELGIVTHLKKYFSSNPIMSFVGILELVGELSKMISFSFRLFGNIFAGEVLLLVISSLVPILGPLPFFGLELFVGLIQALVFTMLSLVFLEIASSDHSGHDGAHNSSDQPPESHHGVDDVHNKALGAQ
jgi:F-type H+-transporting ATPase subunit a